MVGFRDAMSDMAETIRRVFKDPPARTVDMALLPPLGRSIPFPSTRAIAPPTRFEPSLVEVPPLAATAGSVDFHWEARLHAEEGWGTWAAGATVISPPLFRPEKTARLEVPALPRKARVREQAPHAFRTRAMAGLQALPGIGTETCAWALPAPRSFRALEFALALPVAFTGEDMTKISKALWMRYTLKLVRETGENIRNLEMLGLYRIPSRGTRQVDHQAATGRLLVFLGPEAEGAPKAPFILARKKDDASVVCCFVEDV